MPTDPAVDLAKAVAAQHRAKDAAEKALAAVHDAIRAATDAGMRQVDIVRITGYTREHIRQITLAKD